MTWTGTKCTGADCVEVLLPERDAEEGWEQVVILRSSKDRARTIAFDLSEWETFLAEVKKGEFDL